MADQASMTEGYDTTAGQELSYRALNPLAVAGLVLGLLSPLAFLQPFLLIFPFLAIVLAGFGWRRIAIDSEIWVGRNLAIAGIVLATFCLTAVTARHLSRQRTLLAGCDAINREWLSYLASNEPHKAHQLMLDTKDRLPLDEHLWKAYQNSENLNAKFRREMKNPALRCLIALGKDVRVRPYMVVHQRTRSMSDDIGRIYAVTFTQDGKKRTLFVRLLTSRNADPQEGEIGWKILAADAPINPDRP